MDKKRLRCRLELCKPDRELGAGYIKTREGDGWERDYYVTVRECTACLRRISNYDEIRKKRINELH